MSRSFRFVRFDAALRPLEEVSLACLDGADALTVGWSLGWRVEVWDGQRPLGVVGEGALMTAAAAPREAPAAAPAIPDAESVPTLAYDAAPTDIGGAPESVGEPRAYNPFRKGTWRRRASP